MTDKKQPSEWQVTQRETLAALHAIITAEKRLNDDLMESRRWLGERIKNLEQLAVGRGRVLDEIRAALQVKPGQDVVGILKDRLQERAFFKDAFEHGTGACKFVADIRAKIEAAERWAHKMNEATMPAKPYVAAVSGDEVKELLQKHGL